ncbi:hypothetical protein ACFPMF_25465 [Larkinella bovis]|uniref:Lipocalin-like domain-containing protein n=1 Tax=Larkinella bovis TaxID=683041 RepID=A0ABW0III7_9BACT
MILTRLFLLGSVISLLNGCQPKPGTVPLAGTWELISATATERDSTFSTFNPNQKMIKIINDTHFAFLNHDSRPTPDSAAVPFTAGGGTYTLTDSVYTEHLDYFIDKAWENHDFQFVVTISGDTLTQKGVEKLEKLGIDRIIIEKYRRVKK